MSRGALLLRLPGLALAGVRAAVARPGAVLLLLVLNLSLAAVLVVPLGSLLSAGLDHNLYGDRMETGASWRWFHTVEREHPEAVGDLGAWTALFSSEGVRWKDLRDLSGPPAMVALAALFLFLLHGPLHLGWLAAVRRTQRTSERSAARVMVGQAVRLAPAGLLLAVLAAAGYVGAYLLGYTALAEPLAGLAEGWGSERWHIVFIFLRLALAGVLLLVVKSYVDLAKAVLAERAADGHPGTGGNRHLPAALTAAGRHLAGAGVPCVLLVGGFTALLLAVSAAWWYLSRPLIPETWLGLLILFVLHQLFVGLRIALRLGGLAAVRGIVLHRQGDA